MLARSIAAALILLLPARAGQSRTPVEPPADHALVKLSGIVETSPWHGGKASEEGPSLAVAIRAGLELDGTTIHEGTIRSDEEGRFEFSWSASEAWLDAPQGARRSAYVEIAEPGFQRRCDGIVVEIDGHPFDGDWTSELPSREGKRFRAERPGKSRAALTLRRLRLRLVPGDSLEALVQDRDGVPCSASLQGWRRSEMGLLTELESWGAVEEKGPGRYLFHYEAERPDALSASNPEVGAGFAESGASPTLKITLDRGAELRGKVVDLDGRPLAGIRLEAEWALGLMQSLGRIREAAIRFEGVASGSLRTDAEGRFAFRGLVAGSYSIDSESPLPDWAILPEVHSTGPESKTIVARYQRLLVESSNEDETRARGCEAFCMRRTVTASGGSMQWMSAPTAPAWMVESGGSPSYLLEPGASHVAGLWSPSRGLVEQELVADGSGVVRRLVLQLPEAGAHGKLRVVFHVPEGDPLRNRSLKLRTLSSTTGYVLKIQLLSVDSTDCVSFEDRLPPGRYRVEIAHGRRPISEQQEVSLEPGGMVEVHLWPKIGPQ